MYRAAGVPYVIGSDDPGIARGSLSQEYVKLFRDYNLTYGEAKQAAHNSVRHSFIKARRAAGRSVAAAAAPGPEAGSAARPPARPTLPARIPQRRPLRC